MQDRKFAVQATKNCNNKKVYIVYISYAIFIYKMKQIK